MFFGDIFSMRNFRYVFNISVISRMLVFENRLSCILRFLLPVV